MKSHAHVLIAVSMGLLFSTPHAARACSDLLLPAGAAGEDQCVVSARTMDFAQNMAYYFDLVPRGYEFNSDDPPGTGKYGVQWQGRFGFVGVSGLWGALWKNDGTGTRYFDGMNERGLSAALLWLDRSDGGYPDPVVGTNNLSIQHLAAYVLSQAETVAEATNALQRVVVWQEDLVDYAVPLLLHLIVHDTNGDTALVEWYDHQPHYHGPAEMNALRVVCNDPTIGEHVAIATNWTMLTATNGFKSPADDRHLDTNYVILPGDSSSASRYLRLKKLNDAFQNYYDPLAGIWPRESPDLWRVGMASRLIGRNEEVFGEYPDDDYFFHTIFTLMRDHTNKRLYFRGVYNSNLKMLDFAQLDFTNAFPYRPWIFVDPNPAEPSYYSEQSRDVTAILGGQLGYRGRSDGLTNTQFSLDYTFVCQTNVVPDTGMMFIYCRAPDGSVFAWSGGQWIDCLDVTNSAIPACYTGSLVNVTFSNLVGGLAAAEWAGTHIYAGYGRDQADMLLNGKVQLIGVVEDPFRTQDAYMTNVVVDATTDPRQLDWQGYAGFQYDVQSTTNLFGGWDSAGRIGGSYGTLSWPVTLLETTVYYRVGLRVGDTP